MKVSIILFVAVMGFFHSCKKDNDAPAPVARTPEEILVSHTWKADEVRTQLSNGAVQYYKRGQAGNTVNYDTDSLRFNTNGTGTYFFGSTPYTATWSFSNPEKSKMTVVLNYPSPITIYWENVNITEAAITYSQYVTTGLLYLASVRRVPN